MPRVSLGHMRPHHEAFNMNPCTLGVAERKPCAQKFLLHNFGAQLSHLFEANSAFVEGQGQCKLHNTVCRVSPKHPHVTTAGLPCQPFTHIRQKTGKSAKTGTAQEHPDFNCAMQEFEGYLSIRTPGAFWLEEVPEFATTLVNGVSCLWSLTKACTNRGYAIRADNFDHKDWVAFPRGIRCIGVCHIVHYS